jgi:hypothetical protein
MNDNTNSHSFALPLTDSVGRSYARLAKPNELLDMYSAPNALSQHLSSSSVAMHHIPQWLHSCRPFATADAMVESIVGTLFHYLDNTNITRQSTTTVLIQHTTRTTTPMDWETAYANDSETEFILRHLALKTKWNQADLNKVSSTYHPYLHDNCMQLLHGKLVALQPVSNQSQVLALIVAPASLCRYLFSTYHASPVTGHMKEFKTLHRLCLRFLWPKMRGNISS